MRKWTMKTNDDFIKNALKKNVQRIDDNSFTERIVQTHLPKNIQLKKAAEMAADDYMSTGSPEGF